MPLLAALPRTSHAVVGCALAAIAGALVALLVTPIAAGVNPSLTVTASPARVKHKADVVVRGTLSDPAGAGGREILVELRPAGAPAWSEAATVTTNDRGRYRTTERFTRNTAMRARTVDTGMLAPVKVAWVAPRITATVVRPMATRDYVTVTQTVDLPPGELRGRLRVWFAGTGEPTYSLRGQASFRSLGGSRYQARLSFWNPMGVGGVIRTCFDVARPAWFGAPRQRATCPPASLRSFGRSDVPAGLQAATSVRAATRVLAPPPASPVDGNGMWIHELHRSGGTADAIASRARAHNIDFVVIKMAHGPRAWPQFNPALVADLQAAGLRVCGYQRMLGDDPAREALVGAPRAKAMGADCFIMDAESEYEGRGAAAATYVATMRREVGPAYPVGFTSFAYADYHATLPWKTFLGPKGAQMHMPQMYWKDIGDSVAATMAHSYRSHRPFNRPIYPLGQLYDNPSRAQIREFRARAILAGADGISWWVWQHTTSTGWAAIDVAYPR